MIRRYNTIMVEITEDGDTYTAPKITASIDGYSVKEYRWGTGVVIESDTDDAQHAEMIADPDIYEQIGGPVPTQISRSQAMLILKLTSSAVNPPPATMHSDIDGYISSLDLTIPIDLTDPDYPQKMTTYQSNVMAHTAWNEEPYFERLSPAINGLGTNLGITQDQLDALFRAAVAINV